MGQTIAEKIIARAAGLDVVRPGEYVTVSPDYTVIQELYFVRNLKTMTRLGIDRLARPDKVVAVVDHTSQAAVGSGYRELHTYARQFAERTGFGNLFGPGSGLRHLVMVEQGFARPGTLIFSDEGNIASVGAVNALNIPISWEVLVTMIGDENWVRVPASVRVEVVGDRLPPGVWVRDLVQTINQDFGTGDDLVQKCVEFAGPGLAALSLDSRQGLLAGMYHAGADTAVMEADDQVLAYVAERAAGRSYQPVAADPEAIYDLRVTYDLAALAPYVTAPPTHDNVVPVAEVAGTRVDQATIGSCASNRFDDLRAAAEVLRGRRVHPHVTMYISPGSAEVYARAAREGLLEVFAEAGAAVQSPGCNTCWGYLGQLDDGEVSISTHQEHYPGRNGSRQAKIYLANPYVVAASAVAGAITDPRELW